MDFTNRITMKISYRHLFSILAMILVFVGLIWLTVTTPPTWENLAPGLVFAFLAVFSTTFGIPFGGGTVSMLPMITLAAYLAIGAMPAAWIAFATAFAYQLIRHLFAEPLKIHRAPGRLSLFGVASANASIQTVGILIGAWFFHLVGSEVPLKYVDSSNLVSLIFLSLIYIGSNLLLAGLYIAGRGKTTFQAYLKSLPNLILFEAGPMIFAPMVALIATRLGVWMLASFALAVVAASLIAWNLAQTSERLQRRVLELDSLQAVGQALSASLNLDEILAAIHAQVGNLMTADNFYVALYDRDTDEVTFPLAVEEGKPVRWRSRKAGHGLTEYVLQSGEPLLVASEVEKSLQTLGIDQIGQQAQSWIGVPILLQGESLGVIALQSMDPTQVYDHSHLEILITIASQAGIAIQNARMYQQTDAALAGRVQELDSILRTTNEGILLLNSDFQVLAANRALANFFGMAQSELLGDNHAHLNLAKSASLLAASGYTAESLAADCKSLSSGEVEEKRKVVPLLGHGEIHLERTITPVRNRDGIISGWLFVFRDLTEEVELARLREDLTHMLIHDLRTPLTALKGSMWIMKQEVANLESQYLPEMIAMAERSIERMVGMINSLLDIAKLESGQMPLNLEKIDIPMLFREVITRVEPLANEAHIDLVTEYDPILPVLYLDPEQMRRVLTNIADNAIKFTPDGGEVRLWARLDLECEDTMQIGISDTGPGIPKEVQGKLFQKFQQVSTTEGRRKGTGLGLAYCKLVVDAHGGEIWVESELGQGSSFIIQLPLSSSDDGID
ncbi:MAG: ATP-binding protein [Anaerolineales bacterium]